MGKIIVSTNSSLDGVVQDPDGKEGWALGGWFERSVGEDREVWARLFFEEAMHTDALLLGRRSAEWFGSRWASRTGPWAERLNALPKYVVCSRATVAPWTNGSVLSGDLSENVAKLKREIRGEIVVYASYQLLQELMARDLVDELRLVVFPVVVGSGARLFGEKAGANPLGLVEAKPLGKGLLSLIYRSPRGASH